MQLHQRFRRLLLAPALLIAVAGCGAGIEGTAVAQPGSIGDSSSGEFTYPVTAGDTPDCAALTAALGSLVGNRPHLTETVLPGTNDPTCSWSKGPSNVMSTLTATVKPQVTDPAVIAEMRNGSNVVIDPRSEEVDGVVLDVVAMALLTPTHSIIVNALDPAVGDTTKLDVAFAIAEYLQN